MDKPVVVRAQPLQAVRERPLANVRNGWKADIEFFKFRR